MSGDDSDRRKAVALSVVAMATSCGLPESPPTDHMRILLSAKYFREPYSAELLEEHRNAKGDFER